MIKPIFKEPKVKIAIMAILLVAACFLTYYFHAVLGTGIIFTHFFYIPIILAALWWKRKGLFIAIFLAAVLILSDIFLRVGELDTDDLLRALMFIVIACVVAILSERIAKATAQTELAYTEHEQIFNTAGGGMRLIDKDFNVLRVNEAFSTLSGISKDEAAGKKCYEVFPSPLCHTPDCTMTRILGGEERVECEVEKERKDNTRIPCILVATPFRGYDGELLGIVEDFRDITERKQVEESLRDSKEFAEGLIASMQDGLSVLDSKGVHIDVNNAFCGMTGFSREELIGVGPPHPYWPPEEYEAIERIFQWTLRGEFDNFELNFMRKNGERFPVIVSPSWLRDKQGSVVSYFATVKDITERKQAEAALRHSEEQLRLVTDALPVLISYVDSKQYYRFNNKAYEEWFGHPHSEITGRHVKEVLGKVVYQVIQKYFEAALSGQKVTYEGTLPYKDGGARYVIANYVPHFGEGGEVKGFFVVARDITDRKQAEEALRESEEQLRLVTDALPVLISYVDSEQCYCFNNKAYEEWFGHPRSEITGRHVKEVLGEPVYQVTQKYFEAALSGQKVTYEGTMLYKDGGTRYVIANYVPHFGEGGEVKGFFVVVRDITDRKQAEEALRESEEKYRRLFEVSPIGITTIDMKGVITSCNSAVYKEGGYSEDDLVGKHFSKIASLRLRDIPKYMRVFSSIMRGKVPKPFEVTYKRKDGTMGWTEIHLALLKAHGSKLGVQVLQRDITERKQAEEREKRLQQELNLASRLASIGELAAGVAHEINNPLTGIMGFSQRLFRKSTDAKARQDLERIHNEAVRAAKVVKNLLTFARHREPKKRYLNINDILQKALELRAYELKTSNIEVVTNFAPRLPRTMVDFYQMQEVLVNIILNAEQAMTEANRGGELTIKTQKLKDNIRISFTDDGPGIPAEHLDKIFNPFFTTRGRKGGTGLGLSVCHGIVERHGGRIYARSKPGKGTTFFVELPLARVKR